MINTMNVGGAETGLVELMNSMVSDGEDVDLLLTYRTGPLLKKLNSKINVYSLVDKKKPISSIKGLFAFGVTLLNFKFGYNLIVKKEYDYEIAYLEGFPSLFISNGKSLRKIASVRVQQLTHSTILDKIPWGYNMQQNAYERFNSVHCVSDAVREEFNQLYPMSNTKSFTLTTGFDYENIIEKSKDINPFVNESKKQITLIGRMEQQKGYDKLFEAVTMINPSFFNKYQINIVGNNNTDFANQLFRKYDSVIKEGYINIWGQQDNPYKFMKNSDFILSCSNYEGFPRVINESLVLNKNVIATDIPSNREALEFGKFGKLYPNTANDLLNVLESIEVEQFNYPVVRIKTLNEFKSMFIDEIEKRN